MKTGATMQETSNRLKLTPAAALGGMSGIGVFGVVACVGRAVRSPRAAPGAARRATFIKKFMMNLDATKL